MWERRELRFAIPPFVLLFSLFWDAYSDGATLKDWVGNAKDSNSLLVAVFFSAASVIPLGFVISSISVFGLWTLSMIIGRTYEICIPNADKLWTASDVSDFRRNAFDDLFAIGTFDNLRMEKGIRDWIGRRWNMFLVSIHSCVALALSHLAALAFGTNFTEAGVRLWLPTLVLVPIFFVNACVAYGQSMRMTQIQVHRISRARENEDWAN